MNLPLLVLRNCYLLYLMILLVSDDTPSDNPDAVELIKVSEIVREYELKHYPIGESERS